MTGAEAFQLRPAGPEDRSAVLALLADSLGWELDDTFAEFFEWKHVRNAFGPSPAWVATVGGRVVAFRTFLCWQFEHPDGRVRRAVRAVDTATHPEYQGRGLFRRLTLHALDEMRDAGVEFVFNTPNDQSRPGYLAMGWSQIGRLPISARVAGVRAAMRMVRSSVPAERWPETTSAGDAADDVLADSSVDRLLARLPAPRGLRTHRSRDYLRWRYGLARLGYRVITAPSGPADGLAVFRVRRRGQARETALCELLSPAGDTHAARALARAVTRAARADYVVRLGHDLRGWFVPLPRRGPMLTWRALAEPQDPPARPEWDLALGDVELL